MICEIKNAVDCEIVHFLEFNRRRDLWEYFCHGPRERMNTWILVNSDGYRTWGDLKRAGGM